MNKRKHTHRFALVLALWMGSLFAIAFALLPTAPSQAQQPALLPKRNHGHIPIQNKHTLQLQRGGVSLNTERVSLPNEVLDAIAAALKDNDIVRATQFALVSARGFGDWFIVSVGTLDTPESVLGYVGTGASGVMVLVQRTHLYWQASVQGTPAFANAVAAAPPELISLTAKNLLLVPGKSAHAPTTVSYKFPWAAGSTFYWWQGWHSRALDIGTGQTDKRVVSSAAGVITYFCKGVLGVGLKIRDADGVDLEYWHIDTNQVAAGVVQGASVVQGQVLGTLRPGTWTDNSCGTQYTSQSASNAHLHWVLPTDRPFTVEGWTIQSPNSVFTNGSQARTCNGGCWSSQFGFVSTNNGVVVTSVPSPTQTQTPTPTQTATPTQTLIPTEIFTRIPNATDMFVPLVVN